MKNLALASVAALGLLSLAACNDSSSNSGGGNTTSAAQPATTSSAPGAAPATTTAPASGATTNSGNVMPTTDNTSAATIETRPDVPQSGSGGTSQANPAGDDATPTAPTPQPGGNTTTAQ